QEIKVASALEFQYRQLRELHAQVQITQAQREAYGRQLELRYAELAAGRDVPVSFILEAQRFWSEALANEHSFIAQYNTALAGFAHARGTILHCHNVAISEGPLPPGVQKRAVEHEEERTRAIIVRERARPVAHPPINLDKGVTGLPELPHNQAPSLPALFQ